MMQHERQSAFKMREGTDDGSFTDVASPADDHMRFNDDVGLYNGISRKKHRFRRHERHTAPHGSNAQPSLQFGFRLRKVGAVIYPKDFSLFDKAVSDLVTGIGCQSDDVGQVIFLFRIIVGDPPEEIEQQRHPSRHDTAVAKADRAFLVGGVAVLDNVGDAACIITHNAAVAGRICRLERGNGQRRAVFNDLRERGDAFGSDKGVSANMTTATPSSLSMASRAAATALPVPSCCS